MQETTLRVRFLSLCAATYGLAIAITLLPVFLRRAPPGQLPGFMTTIGYDAHASFRFLAAVILLPIVAALALRPVIERLGLPATRIWAANAAAAALLFALWYALVTPDVWWTVLPPLAVVAVCTALRRVELRFRRQDVILIPTVLMMFMALADSTNLPGERILTIVLAAVFAMRLALVFIRPGTGLAPGLCFAAAPAAMILQTHFLARDQRHFGWAPILIATLTPFLLRFFVADTPAARRRVRGAIACLTYPLVAFAYVGATSISAAEGKPRVEFFEDAQHLVPAGEMLRGETPYRDIVPPHGFIQDGLIDYLILRSGPVTIGRVLRFHDRFDPLTGVALYALTAAATGSADVGLLGFLTAVSIGAGTGPMRILPSMIALAFACYGVRRRSARAMLSAGSFFVLSGLMSIDFSLYTGVALIAALLLFGSTRAGKLRALLMTLGGAAMVGIPAAIGMAIRGFLVDYFRVSLLEVATLGPVYALDPFNPPMGFRRWSFFPDVLASLFDHESLTYLLWLVTLVVFAVAVTSRWKAGPRRRDALRPLLVLAVFMLACGVSYAERHHLKFQFFMPALLVATLWRMSRSRSAPGRRAVPILVVALLMSVNLTVSFAIIAWVRRTRTLAEAGWTELALPRARGAYFRTDHATTVETVRRYLDKNLRPDETFFDFTNRGLLHFLLDRDCPVRQIEVAFYEAPERQREVIARLESNRKVRAVLIPTGEDHSALDGVPNEVRAPLVWKYLQTHYTPDVAENGVTIWRRNDPR